MSAGNSPLDHDRYAWTRNSKPAKQYAGNQTVYIRFADSFLTVRGYHIPGERDTNTPEQFEVHEVFIEDYPNDISEVLGEDRCKEIAQAIIRREGVQ